MPFVEISFEVELVSAPKRSHSSMVPTSEPSLLDRLVALGFKAKRTTQVWQKGDWVEIVSQEGSEELCAAFELVASVGFSPCPNRIATQEQKAYQFRPRRIRKYNKTEIENAEQLTPHPFHVFPRIGSWTGCLDGRWVVAVDEFQKEQVELGQLDAGTGLITTKEFVASLHEVAILEAVWDEVLYDEPERVIKRLGTLSSAVTMPRCLLPRQNADGHPWKDEDAQVPRTAGCYWNDGGYQPEELRFNREEVEALGAFDIAVTQEKTGMHPGLYCHSLVVSQRFREFVEKRYLPSAQWVPVRLV